MVAVEPQRHYAQGLELRFSHMLVLVQQDLLAIFE